MKPKLFTLASVKSSYEVSVHVKLSVSKYKRCLISQLLCGTLPLEVDSGHYHTTPRELRLCQLCKTEVEDDIHILFKCPALLKEQVTLYNKIPDLLHTGSLMERLKTRTNMPHIFGNHISNIWREHNEILSNLNKVYNNSN